MTVLAREELRGAAHPSSRELIAYHRGQLLPAEEAAIRQHLSLCAQCTQLVLDAADFLAGGEEPEASPADLESSWQQLQAALHGASERPSPSRPAAAPPGPSPAPAPAGPPRFSLVRSLGFAYALAGAFAAASMGLLVFIAQRQSPPPRPQANVGLYDLAAANSRQGEGIEIASIRFASPADSALLILNPAARVAPSARHGVRIRRHDGSVIWHFEGLVPQPAGGFHLGLPAGALPPGTYDLELYEIAAGREASLGTYSIAIEK